MCSSDLLITAEIVDDIIADYIKDNCSGAGTIYILGGPSSVSSYFENLLNGYTVKRLAGSDRFDTNLLVLNELQIGETLIICSGLSFPDGLSASALNYPVMLVYNFLSDAQKTWISSHQIKNFYILGGSASVNQNIENTLKTYGRTIRIAGEDRFDTSFKIANYFFSDNTGAIFTSGLNYPDGLCSGPLAQLKGYPIILTADPYITKACDYTNLNGIHHGVVIGGGEWISDTKMEYILDFRNVILPDFYSIYDYSQDSETVKSGIETYLKENGFENYSITVGEYQMTPGVVAYQNYSGKVGNRINVVVKIQK